MKLKHSTKVTEAGTTIIPAKKVRRDILFKRKKK